jgi:HAE1 family hydrophobic/amphiphilic exporter-1
VAEVTFEEVPDGGLLRWNGEPGVLVELHRAPGANAVLLARDARRRLAELGGRTEGGVHLRVVRDRSREVTGALAQLAVAGLLGLALGTVVLRFLLGSWRPTLALLVVVPASIVIAFGGFYLFGVSLDVVSLAGLALAAGMLVDGAVVVLESIEVARHRAAEGGYRGGDGDDGDGDDPVIRGTRQIALPLVAGFLTTAVVFLPLIYLRGLARAFFGVQAFAIVTTLAVSLALSLTLVPVLARRLARGGRPGVGRSPGRGTYLRLLRRALERPAAVVAAALLLLAAAAALLPALPRELMPEGPSRALRLEYRLPPGTSVAAAAERVVALEGAVGGEGLRGGATQTLSIYRGPEQADTREDEKGELELIFPDPTTASRRRPAVTAALATVPGVVGRVEPRRSAVASAVERSSRRLEVEATAATEARARRLAERLAERLGDTTGDDAVAVAGDADFRRGRPALGVRWDRPRLARLDADAGALAAQLRAGLGDLDAGRVAIEGVEPEILLAATEPADPELLPVRPAADGGEAPRVVPLAAVAALEPRRLAPPLERSDGRPAVRVAVDRDRLAAAGVSPARLAALLAEVPRGADEELRPVGWSFEMARSFTQLRLALALALVLVFLTVAALYESLAVPVVVMTTVPVAAAGALLALAAGGQSLNVMSFLGVVLLAGIVVNNAIVLVHRAEELRGEGAGGADLGGALLAAAGERYRPILMTTLTTLLGMVPLALLGGEGVELRRALAVAVIGGLVTSFFAALFLVPVLHRALTGRRGGG